MLLLLPNYTEVQLVIYLEAATRFCAAETPKRQTSSPWSQVIHLRVIKSMQAVFIMRKMEKCKGNTTSHKHPPGHSDTYQTPIYRDTLFPSAQNTLRTAYFLTKCGVLKQGGFRDIGSTFEKAVLFLCINRLPELKFLIYPTCQWKGIMEIKEKKNLYSFSLIFIKNGYVSVSIRGILIDGFFFF